MGEDIREDETLYEGKYGYALVVCDKCGRRVLVDATSVDSSAGAAGGCSCDCDKKRDDQR